MYNVKGDGFFFGGLGGIVFRTPFPPLRRREEGICRREREPVKS